MWTLDTSRMEARLDALRASCTGVGKVESLGQGARWMAKTGLPSRFDAGGPGWPPPRMRPGKPLRDVGALANSFAHEMRGEVVVIAPQGAPKVYARVQSDGETITPKKQWLLLPLSPPLSISERREWPRGKAAIRARYPGSFFLKKGPEGPGVYRPSRTRTATRIASAGKRGYRRVAAPSAQYARGRSIERIAAALKSVTIPPRPFMFFSDDDLDEIVFRVKRALLGGRDEFGQFIKRGDV